MTTHLVLAVATVCLLVTCNVATGSILSPNRISCEEATAVTVDGNMLLGTWYEAARRPEDVDIPNEECVQLIIQHRPGSVSVIKTFSLDPTALYKSQTINKTVTYDPADDTESFVASFQVPIDGVTRTMKFLETDYENYALICEYIPSNSALPTQNSNSGAFILTRKRHLNILSLIRLVEKASVKYSDFQDLTIVNQSSNC